MEYKKYGNSYVIRLDAGEEIVESLKTVCRDNNITLGSILGFGTTSNAKIGLLETDTKVFRDKVFTGDMEITNLTGTASRMNGDVYLHIHITLATPELNVIGGHLEYAYVGAVAEIFINAVNGGSDRKYSETAGVNLLLFKD
jgi:predicted DNA-binding protein with PD1-like motif